MASDQSSEMDVQFIMQSLRKRKRPACSQNFLDIERALDLSPSGSSAVICEPSLVPPIVTLTPARTTSVVQDSVTVDEFVRQLAAKVPEPHRKRKLLARKLQKTRISSPGSIVMRPAVPHAHAKNYSRNQGRLSKTPIKEKKPMTLTQRLTRAAILSHVETDEILHSPATSSSRPPLNFVPFQKFATPPSRKRSAASRGESSSGERSHLQPSAARCHRNPYQRPNPIHRKSGSDRSGCLPLTFIPLHEAEDAYAAKFS
ncbi:hypothetical protein K503DRAFT_868094 [Rhizopogon vinicolor AM-OR11-026]|uniref:Uncharacterized protein n=1 Tax=Rhizopogon vinicolor AM-OR11-026 TaxID=1314800 RepID=A0A1B7MSR8_9AGAM|nr:hypothetical protein K503DRAFT_868094 [Rhizopogon vinicolor AM-OR11-026]